MTKRWSETKYKEGVLALLAVISVFTIVIEYVFTFSTNGLWLIYSFDMLIVIIFGVDLHQRAKKSGDRKKYFRDHWYEILALIPASIFKVVETQTIIGSMLRSIRLVRFARIVSQVPRLVRAIKRLAKVFHHHQLTYIMSLSVLMILFGATGVYIIESPIEGAKITTLSDSIWWALATVTTVGYGDVVPVTLGGRIAGAVLMVFGIATLGLAITVLGAIITEQRIQRKEETVLDETKKIVKKRIDTVENMSTEEMETFVKIIRSLGNQKKDKKK